MTLEERSELVLAFARVLYTNGQSTDETVEAAERLARALGLRARLLPRWGELQLEAETGAARSVAVIAADPAGVEMDRVVAAMRAADEFEAGSLSPAELRAELDEIAAKPP